MCVYARACAMMERRKSPSKGKNPYRTEALPPCRSCPMAVSCHSHCHHVGRRTKGERKGASFRSLPTRPCARCFACMTSFSSSTPFLMLSVVITVFREIKKKNLDLGGFPFKSQQCCWAREGPCERLFSKDSMNLTVFFSQWSSLPPQS